MVEIVIEQHLLQRHRNIDKLLSSDNNMVSDWNNDQNF